MGNTQAQQSKSRRDQEPSKPPEEELGAKKFRVIEIIKKVIESGGIISKVTNEPLSRDEKTDYLGRVTFHFISEEGDFHNRGGNPARLSPTFDKILRLAHDDRNLERIKGMVEAMYENLGNTQAQQPQSRRDQEQPNSPEQVLAAKKNLVVRIIREVIESGRIISKETNTPLSIDEQTRYLARVTFYFIDEEKSFHNDGANSERLSPSYDSILRLAPFEQNFENIKAMVETFNELSRIKEEQYKQWIEEQRRSRMPRGSDIPPRGQHATNLNEQSLIEMFLGHLQDHVWGYLTGTGATASSFGKSLISTALDEAALSLEGTMESYKPMAGVRAGSFVGGCYLVGVIGWNGYKVFKGQRSWRRAGKNVLSEVAAVVAGTAAGVVVGTLLAPFTLGVSLFFAGVAGIASSMVARSAVQKPTCWLLDISGDEMLEKSYLTIDAKQRDEMDTIGRKYRLKSRAHHPDKFLARKENPTEEEKTANLRTFLKIQAAYRMIVTARAKDKVEYENAREHFEKIVEEEELEKKSISVMLKIQILSFWNKIPCLNRTAAKNFPAIMGGILPFKFFEETESPDKAASGKKVN